MLYLPPLIRNINTIIETYIYSHINNDETHKSSLIKGTRYSHITNCTLIVRILLYNISGCSSFIHTSHWLSFIHTSHTHHNSSSFRHTSHTHHNSSSFIHTSHWLSFSHTSHTHHNSSSFIYTSQWLIIQTHITHVSQ